MPSTALLLTESWARITSSNLSQTLVSLCLLLIAALGIRLAERYYRDKSSGTSERRRSAYLAVRNSIGVIVGILLLVIWGGWLQHFALSLAALTAGVAIAGKEFFMSGLGSLMRMMQRSYVVGDLIEVATLRGEVIEINLMSTRLLEQGPTGYVSGRTVEFPNMMLLLNPVRKLSHTGRFLHEFIRIPIEPGPRVLSAKAHLLQAGTAVTEPWIDEATRHFKRIAGAYLIDLPESKPIVLIEPVDARRVDLVLRFTCPTDQRLVVSQQILDRYYAIETDAEPA
ncbi:MAG: mechanosensitive ion channel family protein [Burkholderiaceae bacterium]